MAKSLLYRLFGVGKVPKLLNDTLRIEGIVASDEGISGSVTYRDFRAPGKYFSWRKQAFVGSIVVTNVRLVALMYSNFAVNVPFSDERIRRLQISVEGSDRLLIVFDPSVFHDDWSGTIEYRFRTPRAGEILKWIQDLIQT
ncbi:MAG: hypothetical protein DMF72_00090 [Acidobacteria bacterium]|nr:MAG: hypothetical protein DMF72_00090 [Acidobacteriota bacterium]